MQNQGRIEKNMEAAIVFSLYGNPKGMCDNCLVDVFGGLLFYLGHRRF